MFCYISIISGLSPEDAAIKKALSRVGQLRKSSRMPAAVQPSVQLPAALEPIVEMARRKRSTFNDLIYKLVSKVKLQVSPFTNFHTFFPFSKQYLSFSFVSNNLIYIFIFFLIILYTV